MNYNEFTILPWCPLAGWKYERTNREEALRDIRECNFNVSCFLSRSQLPLAKQAGIKALLCMYDKGNDLIYWVSNWPDDDDALERIVREAIAGTADDPDVYGYYVTDEPSAKDYPKTRKVVELVNRYAPNKVAYINLFPNYAICGNNDLSQLGTDTYEEYLDRFAAEIHPDYLSLDNYLTNMSDDLLDKGLVEQYFLNLKQARDACDAHGLDFHHVILCSQLRKNFPIPTMANLLFQVYTSLAAGAKGLAWYPYFGMNGEYGFAPIDDSGSEDVRTPTWYLLQEVNRRALAVGRLLFPMTPERMYASADLPASCLERISDCPFVAAFSATQPCLLSTFTCGGHRAFLLVNCSTERSAKFSLSLRLPSGAPSKQLLQFSVEQNRFIPFADDALAAHSGEPLLENRWLEPGGGLVLLPREDLF